jgi:hypothetical protein
MDVSDLASSDNQLVAVKEESFEETSGHLS